MTPQPELLERLKAFPTLTNSVPVQSWAADWRDEYIEHYKQWARITGSFPLRWGGATPGSIDNAVSIANYGEASLCIHCSPPVPNESLSLGQAISQYRKHWRANDQLIADRAPVGTVWIDLEGFSYKVPETTCVPREMRRHNRQVQAYNRLVYETAKRHVGEEVPVRRWGALQFFPQLDAGHGGDGLSKFVQPYDPFDGGFCCSMYNPLDMEGDFRKLQRTIDHARRNRINEGAVWLTTGCSQATWQCPGAEAFEHLTARIHVGPYDPWISHRIGSLFRDRENNAWMHTEKNGVTNHNDTFPQVMDRVTALCLWPGIFHEPLDKSGQGWHAIALLDGIAGRPFDESLREMVAKAWKERI